MSPGRLLPAVALALLLSVANARTPWHTSASGGFEVRTAASADAAWLPEAFRILTAGAARVSDDPELGLCNAPLVVIHPELGSFEATTGMPWFILAVANRSECRIDTQRVAILEQHGGLRRTLLHELHHLAQPEDWERWRAEGRAQAFAGERPAAAPLHAITPAQLNALLAAPTGSEDHLRALATALNWVLDGR
mgnify:CR=1 FL=1